MPRDSSLNPLSLVEPQPPPPQLGRGDFDEDAGPLDSSPSSSDEDAAVAALFVVVVVVVALVSCSLRNENMGNHESRLREVAREAGGDVDDDAATSPLSSSP